MFISNMFTLDYCINVLTPAYQICLVKVKWHTWNEIVSKPSVHLRSDTYDTFRIAKGVGG